MPLWHWNPVPIPDPPHASSSTLPPGGAALLPSVSASFDTANVSLLSNASVPALLPNLTALAALPSSPLLLYVSVDTPTDHWRKAEAVKWLDKHHKGGSASVAFVDGANPDAWPSPSGGLASVKALARRHLKPLHRLKHADFDAKCKNEQYYSCPCFKYNVEGFCTHPTTGRSPAIGREHHIGCMLTTLKAWMTAREANASAAVVQESDASFVGDARDYDAVLAALLGDDDTSPQAPAGWDVVKMDLGRVGGKRGDGTSDGIKPEERSAPATTLTIDQHKRNATYSLYRWRGLGVAGSGHHLYSRRFLDAFPQIVHDRGIGMIDAWVGELCDGESEEPRKGHLRCYTLHCDGCEATEGPV